MSGDKKYQCEESRCKELFICYGCLDALKNRHDKLLEFVNKVSNEDMGYSPLAKEAQGILNEIGEI